VYQIGQYGDGRTCERIRKKAMGFPIQIYKRKKNIKIMELIWNIKRKKI
jgi:hypothetical protein